MDHSRNKVLIVSSWAPPDIGGPQNLYTLFSQFSPDAFAILTSYFSEPDRKRGQWLPCDYYYFDHAPMYRQARGSVEDYRKDAAAHQPPGIIVRIWGVAKALILTLRPLKNFALSVQFLSQLMHYRRAAQRTYREVRPRVIVGVSDVGPALLTAYWLSRRTGAELMYFLFDIYRGNNHEAPAGWFANRYEERMFTHAKSVIVTNEGTQRFLQRRYPKLADRFVVIHNAVFPEHFPRTLPPYAPQPPFRIVFTGHIYWAQERSVINLMRAMDAFRGQPVTLELYVPNRYGTWLKELTGRPNIVLHDALPHAEIAAIQATASILFLPLAWGTKAPDIIRTATPGKFTDYLAAGRPMLVHAPPDAYVSEYGREHQVAEVVDTEDQGALVAAIQRLLADPAHGQRLIENARRIFFQNHDARRNAERLKQFIGIDTERQGQNID